MRNICFRFSVGIIAVLLGAVACGGGAQPTVTGSKAGPTEPASLPTTSATASPQASGTGAAQSPTATSGVTGTAINMSRSNVPGSTIDSKQAEQMVVGRGYDEKKPAILEPDWTVPVNAKKVYFGFGVKNGPQQMAFTQTLILNGERFALKDLTPLSVPPSSPGKKQFLARGLAVKSGLPFPEGRYSVEVYSGGNVIQKTSWDVKRPASASTLNIGWRVSALAMVAYHSIDLERNVLQIDPDIFEVIEEPVVTTEEESMYYDEKELKQAYADQVKVDSQYQPFPQDIEQAIEAEDDRMNAAQCEDEGGTYDPSNNVCFMSKDPVQACDDLGGTYIKGVCSFAPADLLPVEETSSPEVPSLIDTPTDTPTDEPTDTP
jgi:hypothetical protein